MTCTPEEARRKLCPWFTELIWNRSEDATSEDCRANDCMAWVPVIHQERRFGGPPQPEDYTDTGKGYCGRIGK